MNEENLMSFSKQKTCYMAVYNGEKYRVLRHGKSQWVATPFNSNEKREMNVANTKVDAVIGLVENNVLVN